jgi:hypothetical protein
MRWKYKNLNPSTPTIRGLPKIHKTESPIRPVINWQNARGYKLAKLLTKLLSLHIPLPYAFNVKNSVQVMNDLLDIPFTPNLSFVSFDIENMYSNVPTDDLLVIIKFMCSKQNQANKLIEELYNMTHTILKQNYFKSQNNFYVQKTGLAMGAPSSSIFSEIYLQHAEHTVISDILIQNNILGYFGYVDDILIAYNASVTDIYKDFDSFNTSLPKMKFTMENETDNQINFFDITITKGTENLAFNIYRKPTTTYIIIPRESCHPQEQKHAAIRFLNNRMNTYYFSDSNKQVENNTIEHILCNNNYETCLKTA